MQQQRRAALLSGPDNQHRTARSRATGSVSDALFGIAPENPAGIDRNRVVKRFSRLTPDFALLLYQTNRDPRPGMLIDETAPRLVLSCFVRRAVSCEPRSGCRSQWRPVRQVLAAVPRILAGCFPEAERRGAPCPWPGYRRPAHHHSQR